MSDPRIEANGRAATLDEVRRVAAFNYGHFTVMQAHGAAVRGLSLHLARLDAATRVLFDRPLEPARVRAYLRHALDGVLDAVTVRITVHARALDPGAMSAPVEPDVLVALGPAAPAPVGSIAVRSVRYARELPAVKHVGTFGLFHQRRLAQLGGYDDALFVADGHVSEGTIWNVAFDDGERIVWPLAPMLDGVTQRLVQEGLAARGIGQVTRPVRLAEIASFAGAVALNTGLVAQPIARIDEVPLPQSERLAQRLREIHGAVPSEAP